MPDRGVKKAFSEPEMHARCEEEVGGDPQMKGYKRMTVVGKCKMMITMFMFFVCFLFSFFKIVPEVQHNSKL